MNNLRSRPIMVAVWMVLITLCLSHKPVEAALQCYECHGNRDSHDIRPVDAAFRNPSSGGFQGNHSTHMGAAAVKSSCAVCHPGSESFTSSHRNGKIKVSSHINSSIPVTTYNNTTSAFSQSRTPELASCNSVNCHFEAPTPVWGSDPATTTCSTCHSAPPSDGSHAGKHGQYYGSDPDACARCHPDHVNEPYPFAHATSAGKRSLAVRFNAAPNSGGTYTGDVTYPNYLPSQSPARNGTCTGLYCHSSGQIDPATGNWGAPMMQMTWSDARTTTCYSCHKGTPGDNTQANCDSIMGRWSSSGVCTTDLTMASNGHHTLVGAQWIRKYPCHYCHDNTVAQDNTLTNISSLKKHVNGKVDVAMPVMWDVVGLPRASYDATTKTCYNSYCHSDGTTTPDPDEVRLVGWSEKTECNSCHGHPRGGCNTSGCHDGVTVDSNGKIMAVLTGWASGSEWMGAMPMFPNGGPGNPRANSHSRHIQSNYSCDNCHVYTVVGACRNCHVDGIPSGSMGESAHVSAAYHVNKTKDVDFKDGGTYDISTKKCSNTSCHVGEEPLWGGGVNSGVICLSCHQTTTATGGDVDSFGFVASGAGERTRINTDQWVTTGHGRYSSSGRYPVSGNPAANFPTTNPCWYCHDNSILHNDANNPFRLRHHEQFNNRFEKECVYCHMQGLVGECLGCHNAPENLSPQLSSVAVKAKHSGLVYTTGCRNGSCHDSDATIHNTGAGFWSAPQKEDVKKQYVMMGVCLQCHDDDSGGQCNGCHDYSLPKYQLGFNPGTGLIKPKTARASSAHFGIKHYNGFLSSGGWNAEGQPMGTWRGGKFCWDCHDPHGDSNIYMVHDKVATTTDGQFGIPTNRSAVVFTKKQSGTDYANSDPLKPYNGICNVCHTSSSRHFQSNSGDGHNSGRICTDCHQHRFADSHADGQACNSCHANSKPVPKHSAFTLPQDCTKCHSGVINSRMDVMGQFNSNSHHVQGVAVTNKHCYACHWEGTSQGIIDARYHEGYDLKNYTSVQNAKVDLVVWKAGARPTFYSSTSAIQFLARNVGTANERSEAAKITNHCISCHSDQNNDTDPFNDCKTPRQYAWDFQSIAARYGNLSTTKWGKVNSTVYPSANRKDTVTKAFSAHGNAVANQGGYSATEGTDQNIPNTRNGVQNVQCYDCHSSHGSKVIGTTSSYLTFNDTYNGGNLKETQAGKGGYSMTYKASANTTPGAVNPYSPGAGQCFDCHNNQNSGTTPWGYQSTFGATVAIKGYVDSAMFVGGNSASQQRYTFKQNKPVMGGHLKASSFLNHSTAAQNKIKGLCTPCHDPHGVSPTLGDKRPYAVPLLKGTWMTAPYREDGPMANNAQDPPGDPGTVSVAPSVYTDQKSFTNLIVSEDDSKFAGLCLTCHYKGNLTNGTDHTWKSQDRIHESVKGWKTANATIQHNFTCSKCHKPHSSGLPKLMVTNCLDYKHRGRAVSGGRAGYNWGAYYYTFGDGNTNRGGSFPKGFMSNKVNCHPDGAWPSNFWNTKTPW